MWCARYTYIPLPQSEMVAANKYLPSNTKAATATATAWSLVSARSWAYFWEKAMTTFIVRAASAAVHGKGCVWRTRTPWIISPEAKLITNVSAAHIMAPYLSRRFRSFYVVDQSASGQGLLVLAMNSSTRLDKRCGSVTITSSSL